MCFSNDAIEKQLYKISKRIQRKSIYTIKRIECLGRDLLTNEKDYESVGVNELSGSEFPIINKIILKDENGNHYTIRPTINGLNFAEGKITYKKYKSLERKGILNGFGIFFFIVSFFLLASWTLVRFYF